MNGLVKVALAGDGLGDYIFGLDPQLLVDSAITILAMFAMFLLLSHLLFNPARDLLEKRQAYIKEQLEKAAKEKQDAIEFKAEYDEKLAEINSMITVAKEADWLYEKFGNGEYKDIFDFVQRVNLSACNRKNIENLALAGAFDSFTGIKREDFFVKNAKDETFTEVLVRYGNKYQMDKAAAANSLFGGENQVDIATPEIIPSPAWGDLERLNKERDLVGIYLSAHPLDEYAVILENVCNVHMAELADLTPLQNRDLTMGGIVTAVREGYTKTGKPYGIAKVEDYSGSAEFAFFGNEWVEKKNFFMTGMFLFMRGKCQPKQWRQEEWEVKISTIELLPEVKEKIIEKLTVSAPLSALDEELITEFSALIKAHPGNAELYFHVMDEDGQMYVNLMSRTMKISVQKEIMTYLKSQPQLSYKIN